MNKRKKQNIDDDEFEDWNRKEYKEDPDSKPVTFTKPPKRYEQNFLAKLDKRTKSFVMLNNSFSEIVQDLGGESTISHIKSALIERFCYMEFFVRYIEKCIASKPKNSSKALARWVQAVNSLVGLSRLLGIEKRTKKIESLQSYVKKSKNRRTENGRE